MRRSYVPVLTALLATVALAITASCDSTTPRGSTLDLDPESYYTDYDAAEDDNATGAQAGSAAEAAPDSIAPPTPPKVTEDNRFDDVGETGFVPTAVDPLSTFALDVDTGSYRVAQRFAAEGYRPPVDSIRTEEWINAFDYGYEQLSSDDLGISVDTGVAAHTNDGTRLVRVGIESKQLTAEERPRANITFVIDTSGSMNIRERLGLVKSSLALLVLNLRPDDTISMVTYGDEARAMLEPTPVRDAETIVDAIESLRPGGSTNMAAGLRTGYREARDAYVEDAVNTVVLASDGVANVGISDPEGLTALVEGQSRKGISLVTVGYGMGNYNDVIMEQLANDGDGFYSYIDTYAEAERLFVDELTPTLTVVARDAKSQVRFDPEVVESYRLLGYENRAIADDQFRDDTVDAGEIGAGHTVTALYEVELHDPAAADAEIGEASVRWESITTAKVEERTVPIEVRSRDSENSPTLDLAATVAYSAEVLRENATVSGRQLTLRQLIDDATRLTTADVAGAGELAEYLTSVESLPSADDAY